MPTPRVLGRVLLMPKGTYSASATYNSLDWVRDGGKSWVCKVDNTTGITPTEGTNWTMLAEDGTDGTNGVGIVSVAKTGTAGLVDTYTITYTDGTTSTFNVTNGASGTGSGDMTEAKYVTPATATGVVWKASTAQNVEYTNPSGVTKTGTPSVLVELTKDTDGDLNFEGSKISGGGGTVAVDGSTIVKNASTNELEVPIDNSTVVVNATSNKVEVPIDNSTIEVDSTTHKVKVASSITTKLSKLEYTTTDKGKALKVNASGTDLEWGEAGGNASITAYSNTTSGLTATNVQDAIDEIQDEVEVLIGNSSIVPDVLLANKNEITITSVHFKDDNALYTPLFEPTELNDDGITYKVLTCVHETVDTTNGKITITTAETPSVNTRVAIQITKF